MYTLIRIFLIGLLDIFLLYNFALAQWSEPVALTTGPSDHYNVAGQFPYWYPYSEYALAWEVVDSSGTDIMACSFDLSTGSITDLLRISTPQGNDTNPDFVYEVGSPGIVFQSDESGQSSFWYATKTGAGYSSPELILYSTANVYQPQYIPRWTDYLQPMLFFHGDSSADYCEDFGLLSFPPFEPINWYLWNIGYPVNSVGAYWSSGDILNPADLRWAWEYGVDGRTEIGYYFEYRTYPGSYIFEDVIADSVYSFHNPVIDGTVLFCEREFNSNYDLVRSHIDIQSGGLTEPDLYIEDLGTEKNPRLCYGMNSIMPLCLGMAFEEDWQGNGNIGFRQFDLELSEGVTLHPAEDRNPYAYFDDVTDRIFIFWESNRDGNWNIYYSYRDYVGVEPEATVYQPEKMSVSVHPNPGNAEFKIILDNPVGGEVTATIFDISGRQVAELQRGWLSAGSKSLSWDAKSYPSGIYLLQVQNNNSIQTQKIVLLK